MANLTVTLDDDLLKRARLRALQQGTSVNRLLRDYLEAYAGADERRAAIRQFIDLARASESGSGGARGWTREDLYERGRRTP